MALLYHYTLVQSKQGSFSKLESELQDIYNKFTEIVSQTIDLLLNRYGGLKGLNPSTMGIGGSINGGLTYRFGGL